MNEPLSILLENHASDLNRSGEGAAVTLKDGRLYLVYGRFQGDGDASPAELVSRISSDGGQTWSIPKQFFVPEPEWLNVMSVSLLRLSDGRIGALFLAKLGKNLCVPYWTTSSDDTTSWTPPRRIIANDGYYVINNDRLVQLRNGRLLAPYAYSPTLTACHLPLSGCLMSDDDGETWRHGQQEIKIEPKGYHWPKHLVPDTTPHLRLFHLQQVCTQEPGVVELSDGRVMMYARSNGGCAYAAWSDDHGDHWSPYRMLCPTPMANGPASIKRLPGSSRLIMLHNDRSKVPYGDPTFQWRTPLAVSVSDDDGKSWQAHAPLIADTSHNYCYYSICFFGNKCLVSTYESANDKQPDGTIIRHNLRSLRLLVIDNQWFSNADA